MCTSLAFPERGLYGRNLDLEYHFGEQVVLTPRKFPFAFHHHPALAEHYALLGMASLAGGVPLYAEAANEKGLYMAGLNFPGNAHYFAAPKEGALNLAPYELFPLVLGQCATVAEARQLLEQVHLVAEPFGPGYPLAPLHWQIAGPDGVLVAEPMADGLHLYEDAWGVLTNNPPFPWQQMNLNQYRGLSPATPENRFAPARELEVFGQGLGGLGLPEKWVFDGYITIFTELDIQTYFFNSIVITFVSTLISVTVVAMAAYVVARMEIRGKALVTLMFSTTLFIPAISISFPIYRLLGDLGLRDTRIGVIFIYSGLGIAVTYFILQSYFMSIPKEMEEAARVDGCGYVGTFVRIILPIAKPGLATAAIMSFLNNWNEFYFASLLLKSPDKMTIPALLGQFTSAYSRNLNGMFSAIIVAVVPTIIVFCLLSETFVKSLTAGAVKG